MRTLIAGHRYQLDNFEGSKPQTLQFIHKEPRHAGTTEMMTLEDGTTNEEVLRVLIDRMEFLQDRCPCKENLGALDHMRGALALLEQRTLNRQSRGVEGKHQE
jgi:hypothetical protein